MGTAEEISIDAATAAVLSEHIKMPLKAFRSGHFAPALLLTGLARVPSDTVVHSS